MDIKQNFSYYASIMLNSFKGLLCSTLCWHNRPGPNGSATWSKYIANVSAEKSKAVMSINFTVRDACIKHNNYYEQNFSCINGQLYSIRLASEVYFN